MYSTRINSFGVCFVLVCLVLTGNALAGTTTATEVTYAREVAATNAVFTIPAGNRIERSMFTLSLGNFFLRVGLGQNSEFNLTGLPVAADLTQTGGLPAGNVVVTLPTAPADGDTFVDFLVSVTATFTTFPTFTVDTSGWEIQDVDNVLGGGGTISVTVETRNASSGTPLDVGTDTDDWLKSDFGVTAALSATTAEFDFTIFVDDPPDTTLLDNGATLAIDGSVAGLLATDASVYTLVSADTIELVVAGSLSGITAIIWDVSGPARIIHSVTPTEITNGSLTITNAGDSTSLDGLARGLAIRIDGTTTLTERTLTITANLVLSGGAGGPSSNSRTLINAATLTTWSSLESGTTVLVANFMNGNDAAFNSRIYLFNSSTGAGGVTVRVFTLPLSSGTSQELTSTPFNLGILEAKSALNVKLAEDILTPLGITTPYMDNEGDLTLVFTIQAPNVRGAAQVFSSSVAFGTNPLQEIPSTSSGSPTVLVANFMNGNNAALNSRVYLFNPSTSPGNVTARVFSLPLTSGSNQEFTATPLNLGTLGAESAMSIRLAEDILAALTPPLTLPYTTDGGNLTVEFTIETTNVRGAAQVFSSDFAFGVYPLQVIPSTSGASPTVLVANFMNGNDSVFNSRIYLWNPSSSARGEVSVRVFSLPLKGGAAQELTTSPLNLGSLSGPGCETDSSCKSALNLKLAEDILSPLDIELPYTSDGGNLTLEFTITAPDVRGVAQVFSSSFAFGTNPLQEIPPASAGSPTVLAANFMNGNNDAFNSRVYLWNPSQSAGDVTVRVFTLPLAGGLAQELTVTPTFLGTLGAKSALNVKLAEDILTPLGITLPYTTDGGNLTLEFTIQAPGVRGAAQVFSDGFGFGTYPLEVIP